MNHKIATHSDFTKTHLENAIGKRLVLRMMFPKLFDRIVAFFCNDDGSVLGAGPDEVVQVLGVVLDHFIVGLGQELIVENPVGEFESVTFLFPQVDLKNEEILLRHPNLGTDASQEKLSNCNEDLNLGFLSAKPVIRVIWFLG